MKNLLVALFAIGTLTGTYAHAQFMIEPFAGYAMGKYDSGSNKIDAAGAIYGARLGARSAGFMFGAEYGGGSLKVDSTPSVTVKPTDLGVFVGFEFPVLLRIYATYIISAKADLEGSDLEGNGSRIGIGFTGLPLVSINIEMYNHTYDEINGVSLSSDLKVNTTALTLSLPLP